MRKSGQAIGFGDGALVHSLTAIRHAHCQLHRLTGMRTSPTVLASQIELCDLLLIEISDIHRNLARDLEQMRRPSLSAVAIPRREGTVQERRERRERVLSSAASASAMRNSSSV
jgi:hypothetical protein